MKKVVRLYDEEPEVDPIDPIEYDEDGNPIVINPPKEKEKPQKPS